MRERPGNHGRIDLDRWHPCLLALIIGGMVKAVAFLLWVAPILLVIAVLLFILNAPAANGSPR